MKDAKCQKYRPRNKCSQIILIAVNQQREKTNDSLTYFNNFLSLHNIYYTESFKIMTFRLNN